MSAEDDLAVDLKHLYATVFDGGVRLDAVIATLSDACDKLTDAKEQLSTVREFLADSESTVCELGRRNGVVVDERESIEDS